MQDVEKEKSYAVRIHRETWRWLREKAFREERTISSIVEEFIEVHRQDRDEQTTPLTTATAVNDAQP